MIAEIAIKQFRCFHDARISGFRAVNLIGGKNNSGKTSLLEAIYVNISPRTETIMRLRQFRRETAESIRYLPEDTWKTLFFGLNNNEDVRVTSYHPSGDVYRDIGLSCENSSPSLLSNAPKDDRKQTEDNFVDLRDTYSERSLTGSMLRIYSHKIDGTKNHLYSLSSHENGFTGKSENTPLNKILLDKTSVSYITASGRLASESLAREYDLADIQGNASKVLDAIRIIDNSIIEIKTLNIGNPCVYLRTASIGYMSVYMYGEAMSKTLELAVRIVNNPNSVLLIDEIENGIHHSAQESIWRNIFELALFFKVQIFATTHSYEMIQAFANAGLSKDTFQDVAAYFEMTRSIQSGEIIGIERNPEDLKYEIDHGMEFRGE